MPLDEARAYYGNVCSTLFTRRRQAANKRQCKQMQKWSGYIRARWLQVMFMWDGRGLFWQTGCWWCKSHIFSGTQPNSSWIKRSLMIVSVTMSSLSFRNQSKQRLEVLKFQYDAASWRMPSLMEMSGCHLQQRKNVLRIWGHRKHRDKSSQHNLKHIA